MPFTFGIASHQLLLRALLRDHLVDRCEARIAAEFSSQQELVRSLHRLDLLLIDSDLPGADVLASACAVVEKRWAKKIALLVGVPGAYLAQQAIQMGMHGVLHKHDSVESIENGIATIMAGGLFVSPSVSLAERAPFSCVLTNREVVVLALLAAGHSPAKIGRDLKLASATVLTHRRNSMKKLGLRSQLHLVLFALRNGLISLDQTLAQGRGHVSAG